MAAWEDAASRHAVPGANPRRYNDVVSNGTIFTTDCAKGVEVTLRSRLYIQEDGAQEDAALGSGSGFGTSCGEVGGRQASGKWHVERRGRSLELGFYTGNHLAKLCRGRLSTPIQVRSVLCTEL